jgi:ADP-ribose pyrophosphatase YjhB (NUDIX family)
MTTSQNEKIGVGTIFISSVTKRILLNLRAPYKTHSLCWSLWGGMVENNETPKEGLLRELEEEMGFVPDITRIYPFDIYQSKDKHFKYYSFVCVIEDEFVPILNKESAGYCWIDLGNWPKPMHQGAKISFCNSKAIEKLKLILNQHQ